MYECIVILYAAAVSVSCMHWIFTVFMYMFAALLTAVAHYIYFRFIDHGFVINAYESQIDILNKSGVSGHRSLYKHVSRNIGDCEIAHSHRYHHATGVMECILRFIARASYRLICNEA